MYLFGKAKAVAIQEEREPLIGTIMSFNWIHFVSWTVQGRRKKVIQQFIILNQLNFL